MATVRILLGIVWLAVVGSSWGTDSGTLKGRYLKQKTRYKVLEIARAELGVREKTGHNDGEKVEAYLKYTRLGKGHPWCAAYISWVFKQAGYNQPRTAWSPALFPASSIVKEARPADIFAIWFPELKRIAHAGFVVRRQGDFIQTIEGNTNLNGSREGEGVYRKMRHKRAIYRFADWLNISTN